MAQTNAERVGRALEILRDALWPYVSEQCERVYGPKWKYTVADGLHSERAADDLDNPNDVAVLLIIMWDHYNPVFKSSLGYSPRSYISELHEARNRWAHQDPFSTRDAQRVFDNAERLLRAIGAVAQADELEAQLQELNRMRYEEGARREVRRATTRLLEGTPQVGLHPWREIAIPHNDVATGNFQLAEFTADLWQVAFGQSASDEYRDPAAFFQRTYLTQGLHDLLRNALLRLSGRGGEPVMELQTNFGGGKTHSMLALFHLFSGASAQTLFGVESLLRELDLSQTFSVRRAVLSGQKISPGQPTLKPDGTVVHTLWGELAWQLGGYDLVAEADRSGTNPGDNLRLVLERAQPCLILIDEWVAHARQLYEKNTLPAGTFDANMSFAQALSEAVAAVPRALLVVSLPVSDTEVGGDGGREALARLKQVFNRVQSPWRPASDTEGYEIVRRRLFLPIDEANARYRDAVIRAYSDLYLQQRDAFPPECSAEDYRRRMASAYPFHPELFDRLYNDWGQLDKFQWTRGVLRLLAKVVRSLWDRDDRTLLIMPAAVPIDDGEVQDILAYFLDLPWRPIIDNDIIGLARDIDDHNPNLKKIHATRRVARTIFLGSAPVPQRQHPGVTASQIRLGSVQPGEGIGIINDALRQLSNRANYLYSDDERFWYSTQPNVTRMAQERAAQRSEDDVLDEIRTRLRQEAKNRAEFARVHICPPSSADVADDAEARLVILDPKHVYVAQGESAALQAAKDIQEHRGTSPRYKRNTLVYLAADKSKLDGLTDEVRHYLAWKSILDDAEKEKINLSGFQKRQAESRMSDADKAIKTRIAATYIWLLYPKQSADMLKPEWRQERLSGDQEDIVARASRFLVKQEELVTELAPIVLRMKLDGPPTLWRGDHVRVAQLAEDFATYLYMYRLQSTHVLLEAIRKGMQHTMLTWEEDGFAYAEGYDETRQRYRGLHIPGEPCTVVLDGNAVLVKPSVALAQRNREMTAHETPPSPVGEPQHDNHTINEGSAGPHWGNEPAPHMEPATSVVAACAPRRFHGSVEINPMRPGTDAGKIGEAIIAHLAQLPGAHIRVTLEIEAEMPDGATEQVMHVVQENARALNFRPGNYGFEDE